MHLVERIRRKLIPSSDYIFKEFTISNCKVSLIYNEVLCDGRSIHQFILNHLFTLSMEEIKSFDQSFPFCTIFTINEIDILNYLNNGFLIIITNKIYACEVKALLDRGIGICQSEISLTGPKDSFTETFNTNLGLIRKRIKSDSLKCINQTIGRYTSTKVGILYIDGIVKKDLVEHVLKNLKKIDIDGIMDSSYLKFSLENKFHLFPTIMMSERPDKACMALLEGKVVIIVDTSPYVLILPSFFLDYFHTTDDYFQKSFNTSFIRVIRFIAFLIAIFVPAIYISVTTRNYQLVPFPLLLMLKAGRTSVPFPAPVEALFMIICFEILKESDIRMSTTSGSAISILGGLVLGDAAVAAGIVSPIMIIVIAISSIAGLIFPSIELLNAIRFYKLAFLLLASFFGILGVIWGGVFMIINLFTTEIFGYSYLYFDRNEILDSLIKIDCKVRKRNSILTNNTIRGRYH